MSLPDVEHGGAGLDAAPEGAPQPSYFRVQGPLLVEGRQDTPLFATDQLWGHLKVYAEGGENDLHAHPSEDHVFVVLQGQATFVDGDNHETVVGPYGGALLPRGSHYRFRSTGDENLVMLRVGAGSNSRLEGRGDERIGPDGAPMHSNPLQIARGPVHTVPSGQVFGAGGPP